MKKMTRLAALLMALLMVGVMVLVSAVAENGGMASDGDLSTKAPQVTVAPSEDDSMASDGDTPTKKPSSSSNYTPSYTAEPTEEPATVVVLDEANEATGYNGSTLTTFANGTVMLTSSYNADVLAGFKAWLEGIVDVDALNNSEAFAEFVKNAKVLVKTVLPDLTDEEVDALIVAIVTSDVEGVELTDADLVDFFGEAVTGELLGLYAQNGYEFCLELTEESILLSARAAK